MQRSVTFHVPGRPQAKRNVSVTPDRTVLYENLIKERYLNCCDSLYFERGTPVTLRIVIRFLPPKSASKKLQADMLEGRVYPLKKPDIDNVIKVVADALNGAAYHDDTQIIFAVAKKAYSAVEGLDITVEEYTDGR